MFENTAEKLYSKLEEQEVDGEIQYFKKRRVYPPFKRDGSINWKNFLIGNWKSFLLVCVIVIITLGVIYEYITNMKTGLACINRENLRNFTNIING